jgi:hypothetical protein
LKTEHVTGGASIRNRRDALRIRLSRFWLLTAVATLLWGIAACRAQQPEEPHQHWPSATVKDIMLSIVDPSADALWESVAEIVTSSGTEHRAPSTDEDWAALRAHAVRLMEVPNLLIVEGRLVARPAEKSANPGIELEPGDIQQRIDSNRQQWTEASGALHDAVRPALAAIDARDTEGLMNAGDPIYRACEGCHLTFWYPNNPAPPPQ